MCSLEVIWRYCYGWGNWVSGTMAVANSTSKYVSCINALRNISKFPGVLSNHTTYTLLPDAAIAGKSE